MVGSWIGRSLAALPGVLASVGAGSVVVGATAEVGLGLAVAAVLTGMVLLRMSRTGVTIDLDRECIELRTFWRAITIGIDELHLVDARGVGEAWPPGVRFVTDSGREYSSIALCYLDAERASSFIAQLESVAGPTTQVALEPTSFRPNAEGV